MWTKRRFWYMFINLLLVNAIKQLSKNMLSLRRSTKTDYARLGKILQGVLKNGLREEMKSLSMSNGLMDNLIDI